MKLTLGSIVNFTPDHGWEAAIRAGDELIETVPVIGWATVVSWARDEEKDPEPSGVTHETVVQAVVLLAGTAVTERGVSDIYDAVARLSVEVSRVYPTDGAR